MARPPHLPAGIWHCLFFLHLSTWGWEVRSCPSSTPDWHRQLVWLQPAIWETPFTQGRPPPSPGLHNMSGQLHLSPKEQGKEINLSIGPSQENISWTLKLGPDKTEMKTEGSSNQNKIICLLDEKKKKSHNFKSSLGSLEYRRVAIKTPK